MRKTTTTTRHHSRQADLSQRIQFHGPIDAAATSDISIIEPTKEASQDDVPRDMTTAIAVFFLQGDRGPSFVVLCILGFSVWRLLLDPTISLWDGGVAAASIVFWWFQEHFLHQRLLHSNFSWLGSQIHQEHHAKPYFHISIEPAWMLLLWMGVAHAIFRYVVFAPASLPLALTATVAYASAGLAYEWAHYLVHTKVPLSGMWKQIQTNHIRHHLVDDHYWFGFSVPWIDTLFGTNPDIRGVRMAKRQKQFQEEGQ